jgi:glycosyltransferase involved in cell wall biosynthesis
MVLTHNLKNLIISVWGSDVVPATNTESYKEKFIKKYLLNKADHLVAVSEYLSEETQKYLFKTKKIEIVPWGINFDQFYPELKQKNQNIVKIGFAKKLYELSGPDIALKAFKYASKKSRKRLVFRIAGDGPMTADLKKEAKNLGIDRQIEWLGWLSTPQSLREFFHSIDIFLMPSRRESFGVAAAEASAAGLPVIASKFGGIPEIIVNKKSGFLVDSKDIKGLGEALILLAENEKLRVKMGSEGRNIIKNNYKWDLCVNKMIKIYEKAAMKA